MRAALRDILAAKFEQGASTITMQLAKNTFLTHQKTLVRKLKEVVLARRIEQSLKKEEILEFYLNRVYFGHGAYGVEMAAQTYFSKPVTDLTLPECALIAGLLKAPTTYSPFNDFERARQRQQTVLKRMEDEGYLSHQQRLTANKSTLMLVDGREDSLTNNYFIDYVRAYLESEYGAEMVYTGGMRVYTTLDREAQDTAQRAVQEGLRELDKRRGWRGPLRHIDLGAPEPVRPRALRLAPLAEGDLVEAVVLAVDAKSARLRAEEIEGTLTIRDAAWAGYIFNATELTAEPIPKFTLDRILRPGDVVHARIKSMADGQVNFTLDQQPEAQGALISLEPHTGYIRALVGGYDFQTSQFNRALYAHRQVGSGFKPIIYALGLERGFTPASIIIDDEVRYENGDQFWIPRNYDEKFHGPTRLREALAKSRNVVTVKLVDALGVYRVKKFARKLGLTGGMPDDLTIALGSMSVTPLEATASYTTFASQGRYMKPIGIKYITDRSGRVMENNEPEGSQVMDERAAYLMTSMLVETVERGTGWRARALRRPTAGKTGTTNDYRDAWFIGYTPELAAGVWVGFDDPRPMGKGETGSRAAAPIWVNYMSAMTAGTPVTDFPIPPGIVKRRIDPATGLLATQWTHNPITEYFVEGTEPTEYSTSIWNTSEPENLLIPRE
jgi:penicillin-binding protein 1A